MYVRDLADSLLRRWMLAILAIAATAGACLLATRLIPPTYETSASVVLVPPKSVIEPTANRFLELSSLTQAADVLTRALSSDTTHELVSRTAPTGTYEVTDDPATNAPVLIITVKAPSSAEASALIDAVLAQAPVSMSELQSSLSVSRNAEITTIPVEQDVEPALNRKSQVRAVVALGVLLLGGGAMLIGSLDGFLLVRAARKELERQGEDAGGLVKHQVDPSRDDLRWLEELATVSSRLVLADPVPESEPVRAEPAPKDTRPVLNGVKPVSRDARPLATAANHQQVQNGKSRGLAGSSDRDRE